MSITFHVLNPRIQAENIALIERIKNDFGCLCFGAEAYEWAKEVLDYNIDPQHDGSGKPFSATAFAVEMFVEGHFWRVPHDTAVFIGKEDLDAYGCAAVLLKKHGQLTYEEMGVISDGNFIHRIALIDKSDKGGWAREAQTELSLEEYKEKLQADPLIALHSYVRERAADEVAVKEKVKNVLKWLIAGVEPAGSREKGIQTKLDAFQASKLVTVEGNIAVVESTHIGATGYAYRFGKYAIAYNPEFTAGGKFEPHLKYTIGRYAPEAPWNSQEIFKELNHLESEKRGEEEVKKRWGGSSEVGGSEQGIDSLLSPEEVLAGMKKVFFIEAMKSEPRTLGETLEALAPFLEPGHYARIEKGMKEQLPITRPTEEEKTYLKSQLEQAMKDEVWGMNAIIHHQTLAHWLSCFSIPDPFYFD